MADDRGKRLSAEALVALRQRLDVLPARSAERKLLLERTAALYGVSRPTLYRALHGYVRPRLLRRADRGRPRKLGIADLERACEIIAALKLRTTNRKGRHLSTNRAIELLEGEGVETPDGLVRLAPGTLSRTTANRYLRQWGYDHARMTRQPAAVRFQAEHSNALWQFDMSPSDLKEVPAPLWSGPGRGAPTLMLYSIVDDRSGAVYQEYRCVYGEDAESALRFFYNAMAPKAADSGLVLQGIPEAVYLDNGPVAKSRVFKNVMQCLGVQVMPHMPPGKDGRRVTARSKGKVERPFRTVKEAYETLYHFHKPENEAEANLWLHRYLASYNAQPHRAEPHCRSEDWLAHLPTAGLRAMCDWERYCAFAREPERRLVAGDARVTIEGVIYDVAAELAGETVVLWWGLFDQDLYVEHDDQRFGPYKPSGGPARCTATARRRKAGSTSAPTAWRCSPTGSASRAPPWTAAERRCGCRGPAPCLIASRSPGRTRSSSSPTRACWRPSTPSPTRSASRSPGSRPRTAGSSTTWSAPRWTSPRCWPACASVSTREDPDMLTEVMEHFGLARDLHTAGFYETPHNRQVLKEVRAALPGGRLVAVTGLIGSGKTLLDRN